MIPTFNSFNLLLYGVVILNGLLPAQGQFLSGISVVLGQKHYYIENTNQAKFFQASNICKQLGMSLASIETDAEKKNLKSFLTINDMLDVFWLSGTNYGTGSNSYWMGTGKRIKNPPTGNENCISTTANNFEYSYAVACDTEHFYICEKPLQTLCGKFGQCRYRYIANTY